MPASSPRELLLFVLEIRALVLFRDQLLVVLVVLVVHAAADFASLGS